MKISFEYDIFHFLSIDNLSFKQTSSTGYSLSLFSYLDKVSVPFPGVLHHVKKEKKGKTAIATNLTFSSLYSEYSHIVQF